MNTIKRSKKNGESDKNNKIKKTEKDKFLPLSHWLRREILILLKDEDLTFTSLLEKINENREKKISRSSLHQHLEVLVNGEFLRRYRETGNTWYVMNPDQILEINKYISKFLS